jgi:MerR family transcriptional regulator, copper efflux regulator
MPSTLHLNVNMKSSGATAETAQTAETAETVETALTIGDLAGQFGLGTHVLRHWESMGLLDPGRLPNGRRVYGPEHHTRVAVILHAREVGLGLDQIRQLLAGPDGVARRATLRRHREDLVRRIASARASVDLIDHALECPHDDFVDCPEYQRLVHGLAGRVGPGDEPHGHS